MELNYRIDNLEKGISIAEKEMQRLLGLNQPTFSELRRIHILKDFIDAQRLDLLEIFSTGTKTGRFKIGSSQK